MCWLNFLKETVPGFFVGVISGIVSSIIVLIYTYKKRSKINLSKKILRQGLSGRLIYGFEITNHGVLAYDLKIEFWWVDYTWLNGKKLPLYKKMDGGNDWRNEYPLLRPKKNGIDDGGFTFLLYDLENNWKKGRDLQVVFTSRHPDTQLTSLIDHIYTKSDIVDTDFFLNKAVLPI